MGSLILFAVIDIVGLVGIYFILRARIRKSLEIDGLLAEARKEARLLLIEINETTDRNITLIEDRLTALRDLLSEADRRMGVMRRETGRRNAETEVYNRLGRRLPPRAPVIPEAEFEEALVAGTFDSRQGPGGRLGDRLEREGTEEGEPGKPGPISSLPPGADSPQAEPVPLQLGGARIPEIITAPASVIPPPSLRERAIELHRSGFSADIIAARLGATISEIELLVSLEEGRADQEGRPGR